MPKIFELEPVYSEEIPADLESGKIYISMQFSIAVHLCACGYGVKTVTPIEDTEWKLTENDGKVTLRPSIGNFMGEEQYHAHYFITENKIEWL